MRKKLIFCLSLLFSVLTGSAQFSETFTDGDFTNNPTWIGNTDSFIVNTSSQLQSNAVGASSIKYYLSTANTLATTAEWSFFVNLKFSVSSANYVDVYLIASASDLTASATSGYFVRIGGTQKEICLFKKGSTGANDTTRLIDGLNNEVSSSSNNLIRIKVVRDANNQWILYRDMTGGTNYSSEGSAVDATYTTSSFFGILITESNAATPRKNHYFDSIVVQPYTPDVTPPLIQSSAVTLPSTVDVLFNEALDATTAQDINNYSANNNLGAPSTAALDVSNSALVHLTFSAGFANAVSNTLTINGVKDISGNAISNGTTSFTYFAPYTAQKYDVVIDEIMSDETPAVSLPEREWVELKNTSSSAINLQGWRIKDATGQSGAFTSFVLQPGSYVILCGTSSVADMSAYGDVLGVSSFPSLNNSGELLTLVDNNGATIHAVNYSPDWFGDDTKKDGGWTLEMINTTSPCSGASNWTASIDPRGGTPGTVNSVNGGTADVTGPKLLSAFVTDPTHIVINFDESLDSISGSAISNYTLTNNLTVSAATAVGPLYNSVNITLSAPLVTGTQYTITASNVTDCLGNLIGATNSANLLVASPVAPFDLVVNEILYNPIPSINLQPSGVDYVEIYNRSNKVIDLSTVYIANRSSTTGAIGSLQKLSSASQLLQPQQYVVATSNPAIVRRDFYVKDTTAFVTVPSMPSYSDDKGYVILCTGDQTIIDEVDYTDKWQFPLIHNTEGVALERINSDDTTQPQQQSNWHSAATSVGYGTPTYKNSQYRLDQQVQGEITVSPSVFSPDNDGQDDFATIDYNFPEPGYVANITIFDASGRPVRYLQKNALCGIKGFYRWDGLNDKNAKLPVGVYVIYTEIFNLQGKTKQFKNTVVLARKN
ncbi:lamin tail domain-containing protein [Ferruginibacter albus]|uniref:lamin tail domain-containing protein n=1 Tax=Ferruginibacter albus TaxID=2875540 RepID=UPI001CC3E565|nr:lamin tail domain-containing protein [Ferruginibacter albus]UAY52306.1 lamin tail domain-containing protein [Ferruginibacter albus]